MTSSSLPGNRQLPERGLVAAALSPHPPIIVPEVGRGQERVTEKTIKALTDVGRTFVQRHPETLLVITPHGPAFADAISIRAQTRLRGDLGGFGAPEVSFDYETNMDLVSALEKSLAGDPVIFLDEAKLGRYRVGSELDHGVMVPLYFLKKAGYRGKLVVLNVGFLPYLDLYALGRKIGFVIEESGKAVAVVASGDLSHRLIPGAPAGYSPRGREFDEALVKYLGAFDVTSIMTMDGSLIEAAGECGLRPIVILLGILDGLEVRPEVLSYEGPFGVGYCVALFEPAEKRSGSRLDVLRREFQAKLEERRKGESFPVKIARESLEHYVRTGRLMKPPEDVPEEFRGRAGVFVSIHREGALRGCIGTTAPVRKNVVEEIIYNAVEAGTRDPRFPPVTEDELEYLDYSVDILSPPEPTDEGALDPKKYGVIVEAGGRRGLLLPDLDGIDTVEEQIAIARRKAGIPPGEKVRLYRFTVKRYH
ncbi:MAG: AmmeMemoRadiSam system protein A [Firmicutes bacterium]|nr:AmmeMemoRadiSam system protein A [Candidatus Fermentithermobacillaceae bacterium]